MSGLPIICFTIFLRARVSVKVKFIDFTFYKTSFVNTHKWRQNTKRIFYFENGATRSAFTSILVGKILCFLICFGCECYEIRNIDWMDTEKWKMCDTRGYLKDLLTDLGLELESHFKHKFKWKMIFLEIEWLTSVRFDFFDSRKVSILDPFVNILIIGLSKFFVCEF